MEASSVRGGDAGLRAAAKACAAACNRAVRSQSRNDGRGCGLCRWCCPSICGSCWFRWASRDFITRPMLRAQSSVKSIAPVVVLAAALVGLWYWNRREGNSTVAFAGLWLLVGLAPALYLRNFGNGDFVRDRYMYLPSIGFAILAAMGLRRLPSIKGWSAQAVQGCAAARAVRWLCGRLACAAGVLGKRSAAAGARASAVSGESVCGWRGWRKSTASGARMIARLSWRGVGGKGPSGVWLWAAGAGGSLHSRGSIRRRPRVARIG